MRFISPRTHTLIGLVVGILLILGPNIVGHVDLSGAAVVVPRIIGIIVVLSELTVQGSFTGMGMVPMKLHIGMDILMGIILAASPWLFSFSDQGINAWVPHLIVGIMMVGYALMTQPYVEEISVVVPQR